MTSYLVVDTNVLVVANTASPSSQVSISCIEACVDLLDKIKEAHTLVLDRNRLILGEYERQALTKQVGPGQAFMKWLYSNLFTGRCDMIDITPQGNSFTEFPQDDALAGFDPSDHKFVAVALTHPAKPPIYNATDSDWAQHYSALAKYVRIEFLCPDVVAHP